MYHLQETRHLLHGIGHQHSLEVVTELQTVTDTGGNGIDVLQYAGVLDTDDVRRCLGLDVLAGHDVGKRLCLLAVATADGQVAQTLQSHFFCMRRTTDARQIFIRDVVHLVEILRTYQVLIRHNTLDGRNDELVADARLQLLQVTLQVR